jgi:hypothetical protein
MNATQLRRCVGNPDAFAIQNDDGSYTPHRTVLTDDMLEEHLAMNDTIGTYVNVGSTARFICFDVDTGDDAAAQAELVVNGLAKMGVPTPFIGIEFSGRKGYHVWVTLTGFVEAHQLRALGRSVLALADVECEVFPKQDVARDLGNLVKLPGGKHRVSGMPSEWVGREPKPMPVSRWTETIVPNLPVELAGRRVGGGATERFPCMDAILTDGAQEGSRNNQLFHVATMLRRAGLTHEYVVQVIESVNEKGDPLDPYELETILAAAENSGPICDQLPSERQCGDLCIKAKTSGLYTRPRQLRNAAVGENVVVTVVGHTDNIVELGHDDLEQAKGVLRDGS